MRQNFHSESTINKQVFLDLDISYGANDCVGGGWTALKVTHILKGAKKNKKIVALNQMSQLNKKLTTSNCTQPFVAEPDLEKKAALV